jgi:tetratricopeptide (TPR) repeat protein
VEYLAVDEVKANVQAKLQAHGRRDWEQAHALLFEHFARQSTRVGGGTVTRASVIEVLGPPPEAAPPPLPTRSTAPAPPDYFTGRQAELDALAQALTTDDTPQAITALQGMGGIGKTALAAQLAAQLDGAFPGGVFWADLPANEGDPLPVLAAWARLCGHDVSGLPDPQARAQAVRGMLAKRAKEQGRLLVMLDDVREGWLDGARLLGSARPPGVPLLLTTRQAKVAQALRARITRLDTLSPDEARALLAALTSEALTGDDADRVAELCGHLPLALELAAAAAVQEGVPWLLARLSEAGARLDVLELDDARRKEESVRLTFDLSYQALAEGHPQTARAFRCLGAFAPALISPVRLAGVLAGIAKSDVDAAQVEAADAHLRRLVRWALTRREGEGYDLHPLLRDYAAALLEEAGEGPRARAAHSAHYLAYAEVHDQPTAADYDALEAERPNLLAAMDRAYREEQWAQVRRFAWALCKPYEGMLYMRGYWAELRARLEQAVRAAESEGHQRYVAAFAGNLATLLMDTGDLAAARREYQPVLAIFEELGDRANMATAYHQLGLLAQGTGDYPEARRLYRQSLDIEEELGNRAGIAITLHQLGRLAQNTGDYPEAQRLYRQSLDIAEELGDRAGIAITLHQLGWLAQDTGDHPEARRLYRQSLDIAEELGDRAGIASTLGQLANLAKAEDDLAEAERLYRRVIDICKELGDIVTESIALFNLALLCEDQGRLDEALPLLERSLAIKERVGSPLAEQDRRVLERVRGKLER